MRVVARVLVLVGLVSLAAAGSSCVIEGDQPSSGSRSRSADRSARCTIADIEIDDLSTRVEYDFVFVTGRLVNNSSEPTGVQIKITAYDNRGHILTVSDQWPASISNIPPKSDYPFETMIDYVAGFDHIDARVIRVKQWRE